MTGNWIDGQGDALRRSISLLTCRAGAWRPHRDEWLGHLLAEYYWSLARYANISISERGILVAAKTLPGGTFTMARDLTVTRMGYGAMQLAGPHVFGPPADRAAAVAVLREVVALGITHIDTSDYYGPHVTNQIIKEALYPYPEELHIVTKVGAERDAEGNWPQALAPEQLRQAVYDNLHNLGLD
ncbi:MAG TPA: aldo/keto reductase, partial [Kofleriaceae bacterium]